MEEGDSDEEDAVRPPDDDAALLAQHPEGVGPREGQSVKLAPSDEEETAVKVAVSVQRALTGTPLISINLDLRDSIATVQGVVFFCPVQAWTDCRSADPQDNSWGADPTAGENFD